MADLPLEGIRILDLSRVLAGPLCTMMLADMGADVIKVERPGSGDETRGWGPPFDQQGRSAYFLSINRNKLSVAADFGDRDDLDLVKRLIADADVVVDNFRPGALERHGIEPDRMLAEHSRLIWCTITGFGLESSRPGYDYVVQAESGWMAITGEADGEPMKVGVALADVVTGKDAAASILAALVGVTRGRLHSADERRLVISLKASAEAALVNVAQNTLVTGVDAKRWGNAHPNLVPYQLFETADRPVVVAVGSDPQWLACATALELPELAADERFRTNEGRVSLREELVHKVAGRLRERSSAEWRERLERVGVPCGVVRQVGEVVRTSGGSPETGMPPATPGSVRLSPPGLDEHGRLVRARGWDAFQSDSISAADD